MESSTQSSLESSQSQSQSSDPTSTYQSLKSYPFKTDPEFATGLSIILSHPQTPASESEIDRDDDLVLQAKCFFYSRKFNISPPINFSSYKAWLFNTPTSAETPAPTPTEGQATAPAAPAVADASAAAAGEPAYPSSFAHIVELITTGQPIPGIQEIPDTVLEGHDISSEKPRRRKPWEKEESVQGQAQGSGGEGGGATATATAATTTSGEAATGEAATTTTTAENVA